jgi:cytoskeletal protein CcmA (bactofilin family)
LASHFLVFPILFSNFIRVRNQVNYLFPVLQNKILHQNSIYGYSQNHHNMFGRKNEEKTNQKSSATSANKSSSTSSNKPTSNNPKSACVIVNGTIIEGDFYSKNDTRLDGIIKGNVKCDARLIMGVKSEIEGTVKSKNANITGKLTGDLDVEDLLSLGNTARVSGNVKSGKIEIFEGASLNGDVVIG